MLARAANDAELEDDMSWTASWARAILLQMMMILMESPISLLTLMGPSQDTTPQHQHQVQTPAGLPKSVYAKNHLLFTMGAWSILIGQGYHFHRSPTRCQINGGTEQR